ncbi:tRNA(Met) cytidine acetyltransferase TmcA [Durusdinium trenchii]|uniref:tRNA(Met) cytidine acetyltransferase TmcA n=1 Tax=Durusdinium trenchii TaxID=1381693 RepID=A0ABP0HXT5_9DINO
MGGSSSRVTFNENVPSPKDPSVQSVVSDPLDEIKFSDEVFWKHLGALKREALPLPLFAKALGVHIAKHDVMDREDGTFLVTTTIGGYYGGEVDVNFTHSYDPDTNTWTQKCDRDPGLQKVSNQVCFRLHSEPRVIEIWCVNDEARNSGMEVSIGLKAICGNILSSLGAPEGTEIEVKADQASRDGSGKLSAQSAPLDSFCTSPEKFIDAAMEIVKAGKGAFGMVDFAILEDNGSSFKTKESVDTDGKGDIKVNYCLHVYDKSSNTIMSTLHKDENFTTKIASYVTKVYTSPFVVEQYLESYPVRHAGADVVKAVGPQVEAVLTKAVEEESG